MGLTIHYELRSTTKSSERATQLVEQMRQLALDLPFETVDDDVRYLGPDVCQRSLDDLRDNDDIFSTVLDGVAGVPCPWNRKRHASCRCHPLEIISFWTVPGPGSEWAGLGLARYPAELEVDYRPRDDDKFTRTISRKGCTHWEFNWRKWERWLQDNGHHGWEHPDDEKFHERRKIKTRLGSGWRYSSFCKTQYASDPQCGGIPNFLKCHISVITLLDRIAKLPTMKVSIDDEGKYGPSNYSDDWREAMAEGRRPTYTWHEGLYDPHALAAEVGGWNEMIAATFGRINDVLTASGSPLSIEAPIREFPNFEQLEFRGVENQQHLGPFLAAMDALAKRERASATE